MAVCLISPNLFLIVLHVAKTLFIIFFHSQIAVPSQSLPVFIFGSSVCKHRADADDPFYPTVIQHYNTQDNLLLIIHLDVKYFSSIFKQFQVHILPHA